MQSGPFTKIGVIGALVLLLIFGFIKMNSPTELPALPSPNGYDVFVAASQLRPPVQKNTLNDPETYISNNGKESVVSLLTPWKPVFEKINEGLSNESRMPYERSLENHYAVVQQAQQFMYIGQAIRTQAKIDALDLNIKQAVDGCLTMMLFSGEAWRGCVLIDLGLSLNLMESGCNDIRQMMPQMDLDLCRHTLQRLKDIKQKRESFESVVENENSFVMRNFSVFRRVVAFINGKGNINPALPKYKQKWDQTFNNLFKLQSELLNLNKELEGRRTKPD